MLMLVVTIIIAAVVTGFPEGWWEAITRKRPISRWMSR